RRAGDLSRNGGQRAVARAPPRETAIEHQHLVGSTLPFPNQPGSGFELGTSTFPLLSVFFELPGKLAELALLSRAQAADSDFLHPVGDSSYEQLAAEMRRCIGFVESAPLLTKLAEAELREARQPLLAGSCILDRAPHTCSG